MLHKLAGMRICINKVNNSSAFRLRIGVSQDRACPKLAIGTGMANPFAAGVRLASLLT
jgi:hypothetical protein